MGWTTDLRFALARLRRAPGFAFAVVLMLALGLGLSVSMFGVLRGVLGALPFPGGDRVVAIYGANARQDVSTAPLTAAEADRLARIDEQSPLRAFGDFSWGGVTVFEEAKPREITVGVVGSGFFPALGMTPMLGRWFTAEEHEAGQGSIVLSHAEWQRQLGGRPDAVGSTIETDNGPAVVVGVMPASFLFPAPDVGGWIPHRAFDQSRPAYRFQRMLYGVAWLKDGVDDATLSRWLSAQAKAVVEEQKLREEGWDFSAPRVLDVIVGDVRQTLWGAFAIALLVLLIACANVAILFDARQVEQRHQETIAHALGASAQRIWRARAMELLALTLAGATTGALIGSATLELVRRFAGDQLPRAEAILLDGQVLAFALLLTLVVPVLVLLAGRLRNRASAASALRAGGKGILDSAGGSRRTLPALAIALSTVSLIAALALSLSLVRLQQVAPGFTSANVHAIQFFRGGEPAQWSAFADQLRERLLALPGVEHAAITTAAPLSTIGSAAEDVRPGGNPDAPPVRSGIRRVGLEYLELLGIPLVAGRTIGSEDRAGGERVVVINRELARRTFGDRNAVGESIRVAVGRDGMQEYRVVGVMEDVRNEGLRAPPSPELLLPFAQQPWVGMTFLVRTRTPMPQFGRQMAETLWALAPEQALTRQFALADDVDAQLISTRFFALTVGAFALCSLLLGVFGVYAVAALAQRRRVREFGLRLAVGARPATLGMQVMRDGLVVVAGGAMLGVGGATLVLRLLAEQTFGLDNLLIVVMLAGAALMAAAAMAALMVPALRAMRTDPIVALRYE